MYFPFVIPYLKAKLRSVAGLQTLEDYVAAARDQKEPIHFLKRLDNPRLRECRGYIQSLAPESLLDVGTRNGYIIWYAAEMYPEMSIRAIDVNVKRVERINTIARLNNLNVSAQVMDGREIGFLEDSFEMVTALEVLEHIEDDFRAFVEIYRIAKRYVLMSFPFEIGGCSDHIRGYDSVRISALLEQVGNPKHKLTHDHYRHFLFVHKASYGSLEK